MQTTPLLLSIFTASAVLFTSCGPQGHSHQGEEAETTGSTKSVEIKEVAVDLDSSTIGWTGEMLGMYAHHGTVALTEANLTMAGDQLVGGSFVADLTTITPLDDNYDPAEGKSKDKLVGHLSSPDFFDVANHPTASFEITEVAEDGSSAKGNLTVRGITNPETVENITIADGKVTGTLTFDRTKYDVSFKHPMQEMVISNDIRLEVTLAIVQ